MSHKYSSDTKRGEKKLARPCKEGMDYFPHDTDAVNDEKIEMLRSLYGNDGYAFYFIMLERIYRSKNFELDVSDAETREEIYQILSRKMMLNSEEFQKILNTAFKYKCFDKEEYDSRGVITSDGIKKRAQMVIDKRIKMRTRYKDKVSDEVSAAEIVEETREETTPETPQSKEKKSKEKKSKEKEYTDDLPSDEIPYVEIVDHLNKATGKEYRASGSKMRGFIKARWNEGFTLDDFRKVIDIKSQEWLKTEYEKYLRPETLFGNRFESYLNQSPKQNSASKEQPKWSTDIDFSMFREN